MIVGKKVKLHPTKEQEELLKQSAGTSRFAYNWALNIQQENYKNGGKFIQDGELRKKFTLLKKEEEYSWLNKYSCDIPKQAIKDACRAYKNFFSKRSKFPRFKSRKNKQSFYQDAYKIKFKDNSVYLSSIGWVELSEHIESSKYLNPRITYDGLNFYLSISLEKDIEINNTISEPIGIDLGIKDLAVISDGRKYKNINKSNKVKKLKRRLKRQQRRASKLYEKLKRGENVTKSKNLMKQERRVKKTYKTMTNIRTSHIHQMTSKLVKTKPEFIVIESLDIKSMLKNKGLANRIQEQRLFEVIRQLRYKCEWYGVKLIEADRYYPSSKTCSECGFIKPTLSLSERIFKCECCGLEIDRDLNASINLLNYSKLIT